MIIEVSGVLDVDGSGDATVLIGSRLRGRVHAIKYTPGTLPAGTDLVITGATTGVPILTKANIGTSEVWFYPRAFPNQSTDGVAETDASEDIHVLNEQIKVVVDEGGASKLGLITFYIDTPAH